MILNVVLSVARLSQAMKLPAGMQIIRVDQDFNDTMNGVIRVAVAFPGEVVPGASLKVEEFPGVEIGPYLEKYVTENAPKAEPQLKVAEEVAEAVTEAVAEAVVKKTKKKG